MAKSGDSEVTMHLRLADGDFSSQMSQIIGGLTDALNKSGKAFANQMESAEKSIRSATQALESAMGGDGGAKRSPEGPSGTEKAVAQANRLMQQMEKETIDAAEGASRMGTEYEEVRQIVSKLANATRQLRKAASSGELTEELQTQNRLRKQAQKSVGALVKKIKGLARAGEISGERASQMLEQLRQASARYSDERIKASKAAQQVERKTLSEFRRMMRARVTLVDALPEKHDSVIAALKIEKRQLVDQVEANQDNLEALERLREVKKTISKLEKNREARDKAKIQAKEERRTEEGAAAEFSVMKNMEVEKKRVKNWLRDVQGMIADQNPFERLKESLGFGGELLTQEKKFKEMLDAMESGGEDAAQALLKAQQRRIQLIDDEIDKIQQRDAAGEASADELKRMNRLERERVRLTEQVKDTEQQIDNIRENQTPSAAAGRKQIRKNMKDNDKFQSYNAQLQMSRLVQDAPFGLMGMVNNLDMALSSMQKLTRQTGSLSKALKQLFFGSSAAAGMLWINALTSAFMILNDMLDITGQMEDGWNDLVAQFKEAEKAMESIRDAAQESGREGLQVVDGASLEGTKADLNDIQERLQELREERGQERFQNMVPDPAEMFDSPGSLFTEQGGPLGYFFEQTSEELDEEIKTLEAQAEPLREHLADVFGMQETYEMSKEYGRLTVEEHAKVIKKTRSTQQELASIALSGRSGEEAEPYKRAKIRGDSRAKMQKNANEILRVQRQMKAAREAGAEGEIKDLQALLDLLIQKAAELGDERQRKLDAVGEGGEEEPRTKEELLASLVDARRSAERAEIEVMDEGLEKRLALLKHEKEVRVENLDEQLEEFKGDTEKEKEIRDEIEKEKNAVTDKYEKDRTEIVEEHERKRAQVRRENARMELETQRQRSEVFGSGDPAEIERSRLQMKDDVLRLEGEIQEAQREGNQSRIDQLKEQKRIARQAHDQRVHDIRSERREAMKSHSERIQGMLGSAKNYQQRIATFMQESGMSGAINGQLQRIELDRRAAQNELMSTFRDESGKIDEAEAQAEDTFNNEMRFFQMRLDLLEWFYTEQEAINEDYRDEEEQAEREHRMKVATQAGQMLSARLGDISQGLSAMQQRFVQKRKQQLIEQGVAEEEAAQRAEEAGRRRFAIKKKVAIAEGIVNTYSAALSVYRSVAGSGGPFSLGAAIAAAGAALTYGFAQVQKIRSMSMDGGGGGKSGGGVSVSGLGSSTSSSKSQVTDQSSAFYSAGASAQGIPSSDDNPVANEVRALRGDMARHTKAIESANIEAKMSDDTAIEAGEKYDDYKVEDRY